MLLATIAGLLCDQVVSYNESDSVHAGDHTFFNETVIFFRYVALASAKLCACALYVVLYHIPFTLLLVLHEAVAAVAVGVHKHVIAHEAIVSPHCKIEVLITLVISLFTFHVADVYTISLSRYQFESSVVNAFISSAAPPNTMLFRRIMLVTAPPEQITCASLHNHAVRAEVLIVIVHALSIIT